MAAAKAGSDVVLGKAGAEAHGCLTTNLLIGWANPHPVWPSPRDGVSEVRTLRPYLMDIQFSVSKLLYQTFKVYRGDLNGGTLSAGIARERFFPETMSSLGGKREEKSFRMAFGYK